MHKCFCLTQQFYRKAWIWVNTTITIQFAVWWVLSVLAVLLWLFDVLYTSIVHDFDVRARLSIFDLRLLSDRRTILIGRSPVLGKSWFECTFENYLPPWTTLSNCPGSNNLSAVICQPYRKCRKIETWFPRSEIRKRVGQVLELRDLKPVPLQTQSCPLYNFKTFQDVFINFILILTNIGQYAECQNHKFITLGYRD